MKIIHEMKLFIHGFWGDFLDTTSPVNITWFIELFKRVFNTDIHVTTIFEDGDILLETVFHRDTFLYNKRWQHTFLFSGESRLNPWYKDYDCVLYGEKNHDNIINVPLFIPYLGCLNKPFPNTHCVPVPAKNICAIISNPDGGVRNRFLEKLEQRIPVDYAGNYKNNVPIIKYKYNTPEFMNAIGEYKFIISMENSRGENYITEKITHGFYAKNIPVYWGSQNVVDYFNSTRFINLENDNEETIDTKISEIIAIIDNDAKFFEMISSPVLSNNSRTTEHIVNDIKNLLHKKPYQHLSKICVISSPEFEETRCNRVKTMFNSIGIENYHMEFICPTYKQTITADIMELHVKQNLVRKIRHIGMKKAEISLFLNYHSVLSHISKNYSDGIFIILESDVILVNDRVGEMNSFINDMYTKKDIWDLIHIGSGAENQYFQAPYCNDYMPYRDNSYISYLPQTYVEDITTQDDKYRLIRKFHTRCTDSFLWTYSGIVKFLTYMNSNQSFDIPFDYYMTQFFENNHTQFKHYWSMDGFFIQGSNHGYEQSTIQNDID